MCVAQVVPSTFANLCIASFRKPDSEVAMQQTQVIQFWHSTTSLCNSVGGTILVWESAYCYARAQHLREMSLDMFLCVNILEEVV